MCNPAQCRYLAQASHAVVALARNGTIRAAEPQTARALGYDAAALIGKPFDRLVAPEEHKHLARVFERCRSDQAAWEELTFVAGDGCRVPMLLCFQRLSNPGEKGGLLVTGMRLEAFRSGGRTDAAAALGHLAFRCHGPAHRLMQAFEAVLMQYPWSEAVEQCQTQLESLLEIMSQSVSAPEIQGARAGAPSDKAVDVVGVISGAMRLVDHDAEYRGLEVSLRPERASIWAAAHPVGLAFLALHMVRNARDATLAAKAPRLLIDIYQATNEVVIEFSDNGAGLPREDMACALSPFFRRPGEKDGHTGLGLSTCLELVHYMGGKMRMQGRAPQGTTVVVTLPAAPSQ
jgi:PAS domain S-box-containing protein